MKLYTPIEAKIKELDFEGKGILDIPPQVNSGNVSNKTYKAAFAFPGDAIKGTTVRRDKGEVVVRVDQLTATSPDRVQKPQCPYVGTCGGCVWQGLQYPKQVEYKRELVNRAFAEASSLHSAQVGLIDPATNAPFTLQAITPSPDLFYYRNRMDFVFGPNGELGLKEPGKWFSYLDLSTCFLLSPDSVKIMEIVRAFARNSGLAPYTQKAAQGFFRYLIIREGKRTGERMLHLLTSSQQAEKFDAQAFVQAIGPLATHILHGVSDSITDLSIAESITVLKGSADFTEKVNDVTYTIPHGSFFQTNTVMAEQLFNHVAEQILQPQTPNEVLDLYCGVGFFALGLAKRGIKTHGVEIDPNAIRAANQSAVANNLQHLATFNSAKAEDVSWKLSTADTVIIDPPRAGMHPRVIKNLLEMAPKRIVYVSCKYTRLVQELPEFLKTYKITSLQAFDLFPHTPHVEVVAVLERVQ